MLGFDANNSAVCVSECVYDMVILVILSVCRGSRQLTSGNTGTLLNTFLHQRTVSFIACSQLLRGRPHLMR